MKGNRLLYLACLLLLIAGCQSGAESRSELFNKIFRTEKGGTFRGVDLGMPLSKAREIEGSDPRHDDRWGYVYEVRLGGDEQFFLEYISRDPDERIVSSIVANIVLKDGSRATDLYNEMESWLRGQYGVADGTLGNLRWKYEETNLYITLRMLDDKKTISLNFVPATGY